MCGEAVDGFLPTLIFVPDWFVSNKMIKNLFTALYADENIFYEDFVWFNCNKISVLTNINLNNINLDNNFDEDDLDTIILIRPLAWHIKFEKLKALKRELNEELMPVAWHPSRWCVSKDEKKEIDPIFLEKLQRYVLVVYNMGALKHFFPWVIEIFWVQIYRDFEL